MLTNSEVLLTIALSVTLSVLVCLAFAACAQSSRFWDLIRFLPRNRSRTAAESVRSSLLFDGETVIDSSGEAQLLLAEATLPGGDWTRLRQVLQQRFPGLPRCQPIGADQPRLDLPTAEPEGCARLVIEPLDGATRLSLVDEKDPLGRTPARRHLIAYRAARMDLMQTAVHQAPYPIWKTNRDGQVVWTNHAYRLLAQTQQALQTGVAAAKLSPRADAGAAARSKLFDLPHPPPARRRLSLQLHSGGDTLWYDITTVTKAGCHMHYATDINAVIEAEAARRNFVQTLTQTFAQLTTGLAIFDRKQELTLFNPALTDLTDLPVSFLSNRPSLHAFFDRLRDTRIMPEPRDYHSWRLNLTALVEQARDGCYQDTWCLASGATYRVTGRPHPDGALAFLVEDISAEMTMSRRFRADLELNQSVLDGLDQPLAVFSAGGSMTCANRAYERLWGAEGVQTLREVMLNDAIRLWCDRSDQPWRILLKDVAQKGADHLNAQRFSLADGREIRLATARVSGGSLMVRFSVVLPLSQQQMRVQTA